MTEEQLAAIEAAQDRRFWLKVEKGPSCWLWFGPVSGRGYGVMWWRKRNRAAHRIALLMGGTTIAAQLVVDHVCRNRLCVNPAHLRVVSNRANSIENSESVTAKNAQKTHCKHGHALRGENVRRHGPEMRYRSCRTCLREIDRRWKARRKAA